MLGSGSDGVSVVTQPWSLGRRILTAAVMFIALGFVVFAAAGSSGDGRIAGAGSTLVNPILQRASTAYQTYLAADRQDVAGGQGDWVAGASALDYDPVGSIGGVMRLDDPAVTFAATEVPLSEAELSERALVQFPLVLGAAAPVANLDVPRLALDADTLAAIFGGTITNWNDPAIAALNDGVSLPDQPIAVRFRRDGSGTSWTFTGYLATGSNWPQGQAAQLDWPLGEGADGSRGMIAAVDATPGAIGYSEVGQARRAGLTVIDLIGVNDAPVSPTTATVRDGWPMTATVHVVMRANDAQNQRALGFFRFFYAEAQRQADVLGYVALSPDAVAEVEARWATSFNTGS